LAQSSVNFEAQFLPRLFVKSARTWIRIEFDALISLKTLGNLQEIYSFYA
jgi:hypothetical protein